MIQINGTLSVQPLPILLSWTSPTLLALARSLAWFIGCCSLAGSRSPLRLYCKSLLLLLQRLSRRDHTHLLPSSSFPGLPPRSPSLDHRPFPSTCIAPIAKVSSFHPRASHLIFRTPTADRPALDLPCCAATISLLLTIGLCGLISVANFAATYLHLVGERSVTNPVLTFFGWSHQPWRSHPAPFTHARHRGPVFRAVFMHLCQQTACLHPIA